MARVPVYTDDEAAGREVIVGYVHPNRELDRWGDNYHLGITRLRSTGEWVLITSNDYSPRRPRAEVVSPQEALQSILSTYPDLLNQGRFSDLRALAEEKGINWAND